MAGTGTVATTSIITGGFLSGPVSTGLIISNIFDLYFNFVPPPPPPTPKHSGTSGQTPPPQRRYEEEERPKPPEPEITSIVMRFKFNGKVVEKKYDVKPKDKALAIRIFYLTKAVTTAVSVVAGNIKRLPTHIRVLGIKAKGKAKRK